MSDSICSQFNNLPIEQLIRDPLLAADKAQQELAETYIDTMNKLAFEGDDRPYKFNRPTVEEAKQALDLALCVFTEYEMPEYEPEVLDNFKSVMVLPRQMKCNTKTGLSIFR
jgi:hypothetical protein